MRVADVRFPANDTPEVARYAAAVHRVNSQTGWEIAATAAARNADVERIASGAAAPPPNQKGTAAREAPEAAFGEEVAPDGSL